MHSKKIEKEWLTEPERQKIVQSSFKTLAQIVGKLAYHLETKKDIPLANLEEIDIMLYSVHQDISKLC